jgi:hypothetical protein
MIGRSRLILTSLLQKMIQPQFRHELACPWEDCKRDEAGDAREDRRCDERVGDSGGGLGAGEEWAGQVSNLRPWD